jgi:hypothetical protein
MEQSNIKPKKLNTMKKVEITSAEINELTFDKILTQNGKMRKTSKENKIRLYNFGITAYKSPFDRSHHLSIC